MLALQGGVAEHVRMLESLGAQAIPVRTRRTLGSALDGIVLPGGESSTMDRLLRRFEMREPLVEMVRGGLPVLGTCAGLILLARDVLDPAPGQMSLGLLDVSVRRNAFGRQVDSATESFDTDLGLVRAAFIRAPEIVGIGPGVRVLARRGSGAMVAAGTSTILGVSFHPELTGDTTFHGEFLARVRDRRRAVDVRANGDAAP